MDEIDYLEGLKVSLLQNGLRGFQPHPLLLKVIATSAENRPVS
ncbi:hypothetical protein BH10PSE19_BH10PSE19_09710 [soil metagenome]